MKKISNYDFSKSDIESFFKKYSNYVKSIDYRKDLLNYYYVEVADSFQKEFKSYLSSLVIVETRIKASDVISVLNYKFEAIFGNNIDNFLLSGKFKDNKENENFKKEGNVSDGNQIDKYQIQFL